MEDLERWKMRRAVAADVLRIAESVARCGEDGEHVVMLSTYEVSNLVSALQATGYGAATGDSPLRVLDTGDWLGQVVQKLQSVAGYWEVKPNVDPIELAEQARNWCEHHGHAHSLVGRRR